MKALIHGIHRFRNEVFGKRRGHFERLARGQNPAALFITCSDSRIDPALLTQSEPGDLFVLRNAGNLIPPYGVSAGEEATIEFAVNGLGVRDIIVCGHSHCGAIKGLLDPRQVAELPALARWLSFAEPTLRLVREKYGHLKGRQLITAAVRENVLVQIANLCTFPAVEERLVRGDLRLHGWSYEIATGEVLGFDPAQDAFVPIPSGSCIPMVHPIVGKGAVPGADCSCNSLHN
jgi:carbonic anhydrase